MEYTLEALRKEFGAGKRVKFIFFWGHTPSADGSITQSCFSQWWMCPFTVDGVEYSCAEQFMMAEKARLFHDEERRREILAAGHPKEMKALGRLVKNFDAEIWNASCYEIVKRGNLAKFSQNPELKEFLLGTGKRVLVEASPRDRIWGIGMGKNNEAAENPLLWRGTNLLGFALTEVRDLLLSEYISEISSQGSNEK